MQMINGFAVLHQEPTSDPAIRLILVDRGGKGGRFVTAIYRAGDIEWHAGHYFDAIFAACTDFRARADREIGPDRTCDTHGAHPEYPTCPACEALHYESAAN